MPCLLSLCTAFASGHGKESSATAIPVLALPQGMMGSQRMATRIARRRTMGLSFLAESRLLFFVRHTHLSRHGATNAGRFFLSNTRLS